MPNQYSSSKSPILVIGPSIAYVPLTKGFFAVIDSEDIPLVGTRGWYAAHNGKENIYAVNKSGKSVYLHRLLLPDALQVDHKNGSGLHNFKGNLRPSTQQENMRNLKIKSASLSGLKGAYRFRDKWISNITVDGKTRHIGSFSTAEDAHAAYCQRASELYGEFANDGINSLS